MARAGMSRSNYIYCVSESAEDRWRSGFKNQPWRFKEEYAILHQREQFFFMSRFVKSHQVHIFVLTLLQFSFIFSLFLNQSRIFLGFLYGLQYFFSNP